MPVTAVLMIDSICSSVSLMLTLVMVQKCDGQNVMLCPMLHANAAINMNARPLQWSQHDTTQPLVNTVTAVSHHAYGSLQSLMPVTHEDLRFLAAF